MAFIPSPSSSGGTATLKQGFGSRFNRRACYFMIAYQSNGYHVVFYDQDFNVIIPNYPNYSNSNRDYEDVSNMFRYHSGTYMADGSIGIGGYSATNSHPSSSSNYYASSFQFNGMNGCGWIQGFSDGSVGTQFHGSYTFQNKRRDMKAYFTSDHTNRAIIYGYRQGRIFARHINSPSYYDMPYEGTEDYAPTGVDTSMRGTVAYNNTLKELHLCYQNASATYMIRKYSGWDFDAYPDPTTAFANVTGSIEYTITNPSWTTNNNESKFNSKMLLRDDGQLHMYTFFTSSKMANYYWTNPTVDGFSVATTQGNTASNTTSYGYDQGENYGMHIISSRDGRNYAFISPYYYYSSGLNHMYSGMGETLNGPSHTIQNHDSSYGYQVLPWRDDGFCSYYAGNGYSSNYSGTNIRQFMGIGGSTGKLERQSGMYKYIPLWPGHNTTGYPGLACVNDYRTFQYDGSGMGKTVAFNDKTIQ